VQDRLNECTYTTRISEQILSHYRSNSFGRCQNALRLPLNASLVVT